MLKQWPNDALQPGSIRCWSWKLQVDDSSLPYMRQSLSEDELLRAGSFKYSDDQRRFLASRAGLRKILAELIGEKASKLQFEVSQRGKPSLKNRAGSNPICFNLSHSADLAFLAVAYGMEIGVDIEEDRQLPMWAELATNTLNPLERQWIMLQEPDTQSGAFLKIWTLKEAVLKAKGESLAQLQNYCILPRADGSAELWDGNLRGPHGSWQLRSFTPIEGFHGAYAYWGAESLRCEMEYLANLEYAS
jgi:4'-phosphopantetheinyl transferase